MNDLLVPALGVVADAFAPYPGLPAGLLDLPQLEKLDLRWTRLAPLPAWLRKLEQRGCLVYSQPSARATHGHTPDAFRSCALRHGGAGQ